MTERNPRKETGLIFGPSFLYLYSRFQLKYLNFNEHDVYK